jgi:pimeloyl-ACP methyl ester carboxylesterase
MIRLVAALALTFLLSPLLGDTPPAGPEGFWEGTLKAGPLDLRVVFKVKKDGDTLKATMDSLDQGARDVPFSKATFADGKLTLEIEKVATYTGKLAEDGKSMSGTWKQSGQNFTLDLKRVEKVSEVRRPQLPRPPFPYKSEDVTFPSVARDVTLAGTLTLPEGTGPFPAAILITGSGPQDRDETIFEHKPFLVLADYLTRKGIAVLRYDDRGIGKSTGKFKDATSADFALDARGAFDYLRTRAEVNGKKIGFIGHSEGGMIAPMVAGEVKDVGFIVLLAGSGVPGYQLLPTQTEAVAKTSGASEREAAVGKRISARLCGVVKGDKEGEELKKALREALTDEIDKLDEADRKNLGEKERKAIEARVDDLAAPWMRYFLRFDPRPTLAKVHCPILALNGEKDVQVDAKENLPEIKKAAESGGNKDVTVKELPGLNHLFQTTKTGAVSEYARIEETFAPVALEAIAAWITARK